MSTQLNDIAVQIHAILDRKDWLEVGKLLITARRLLASNQKFGNWLTEQNFAVDVRTLHQYRTAAEFIRNHDSEQLPKDWNTLVLAARLPDTKLKEVLALWRDGECLSRSTFRDRFFPKKLKPSTAVSQEEEQDEKRRLMGSLPEKEQVRLAVLIEDELQDKIKQRAVEINRRNAEEQRETNELFALMKQEHDRVVLESGQMKTASEAALGLVREVVTLESLQTILNFCNPAHFTDPTQQEAALTIQGIVREFSRLLDPAAGSDLRYSSPALTAIPVEPKVKAKRKPKKIPTDETS